MPIMGGGGGGAPAFNGGTITTALEIDAGSNQLTLGAADGTDLTLVTAGANGTQIFNDPNNTSSPAIRLGTTGGLFPGVRLYDDGFSLMLDGTAGILRLDAGTVVLDNAGWALVTAHTEPADATLNTGQCALWFDQTHGAAKLMLKAKDGNNTVVTAAIALS